jgi:hypothetical protein
MTILSKSIATIAGAAASAIAFTALPSYAGTITATSLSGLGQNTGSITSPDSTNTISVTETFNNPNTISKILTVASSSTSNIYNFVVNATNSTGFSWGSFRFNLNASGNQNDRPTFSSISGNLLPAFTLDNTNGFLEFAGGSVANGQTAQFLFSVTVPSGFSPGSGRFEIEERPFAGGSSAIPTPAVLPAMIGFGAGLLRKRRLAKLQAA